jgi:DNA-directed RNA polymerase
MSTLSFDALLQRQAELENHCLKEGAERFKRRVVKAEQKGQATTEGAARKLLLMAMEKTEELIRQMIAETKTPGRRGRKHVAVKWCEMVGPDVAAYMTCKTILDDIGQPKLLFPKLCHSITRLITDELRFRRFQQLSPGLFKYRLNAFATTSYAHMARSLSSEMTRAICTECYKKGLAKKQGQVACEHLDMSDLTMGPGVSLQVGGKLLDCFTQATGMCEVETIAVRKGRRVIKETHIKATELTRQWIEQRNDALMELWPLNLPMVVPPMQWGVKQRGGYRFGLREKYTLIRSKTSIEQFSPLVYAAVNRIQETPWKINPSVLELIERIIERGGDCAGVPATVDAPAERKPPEIPEFEQELRTYRTAKRRGETLTLTDEVLEYRQEWKQWKKAEGERRNKNHARKLKAKEFYNTLNVARLIAEQAAIWFPYNLDFRGRVYPITTFLSPQGDDLSKGLLTFAEGRALGGHGASWLAQHGANCLKDAPDGTRLNRATTSERITWIAQHTEMIEQAATDPITNDWWMEADKPLQFYAFCVEWAGYAEAVRQGKGEEFVSSLPCAMDGTCNGLQHFAALLRDETAAVSVNVMPNEQPHDIYDNVSDVVLGELEMRAGEDELARKWLASGVVDRKFCKRPAMTFGYGSKKFGFRGQILEYFESGKGRKHQAMLKQLFADGEKNKLPVAATFAAELIWDALRVYVPRAFEGMEWLQQVARLAAANKKCVSWRVPVTGFQVRQDYVKYKLKEVKTVLAGKVISPRFAQRDESKPNALKQQNAVAPNFIHSLDAAALMMTVEAASNEGVQFFGMVHDSYATHATDCPVLAQCTRQAFYRLYVEQDVLGNFAEQMKGLVEKPEEFPAPPQKGNLDLAGVLVSEYFFS